MVGVLHMTNNMRYRQGPLGTSRQDRLTKAPAELSPEEVERINGLVRELRQRLVTETPQEPEVVEPPPRPGFVRALGRAFRRS